MATTLVQEPYNLFAMQKMAGYPSAQPQQIQQLQQAQPQTVPVQTVGETPEQFAQGKFNNGQPVVQTPQTTPVTTPQANKPAGTVDNLSGTGFASHGSGQQQPITSMDDLAKAMGYTSPEEEDRLRKASVANQRMLAVVDALRHIGNIAHTVNYAPSQQFNSPVMEEHQRYLQGKAMRDRANQTYISYQQQKAKQDAEQRRWEQQFQLNAANAASQAAYRQEQARIAAERAANQKAYQEGNLARQTKADEARNRYNEARLKQDKWYKGASLGIQNRRLADQQRRTNAYVNRQSSGGGSGVAPLDTPKGRITPNGRSYSNQLLQMFDYAKSKGYVKESDVARRLREMGFGKDQSDNVKRQMVMDLLRTNQDMGDYASSRLGWSYGAGGGGLDLGLEDDEDEMDLGLE